MLHRGPGFGTGPFSIWMRSEAPLEATRNECIASRNKCLTSSNKKLLETVSTSSVLVPTSKALVPSSDALVPSRSVSEGTSGILQLSILAEKAV